MTDRELTRRKVLSGMAIAGGTGALAGHSTVSFFSDEETFSNNSIRASRAAGGIVDSSLETYNTGDNRIRFEPTLPDTERANPAFFCVQAAKCPCVPDASENCDNVGSNGEPCVSPYLCDGIDIDSDDLRVELRIKYCDGEPLTLTGSVREILDMLQNGLLLPCKAGDDPFCIQPGGETPELVIKVVEVRNDMGEWVAPSGDGFTDLEFELKITAEQCRSNEPSADHDFGVFDLLGECPTENECPPTGDKGISWIAFCRRDDGSGSGPTPLDTEDVRIETLRTDEEGGPTSIIWQLEDGAGVDYVVMFGGGCWTLYDYRDISTSYGIATTGGNTDYDKWLSCNPACEADDELTGPEGLADDKFSCPNGSGNNNNGSNGSGNKNGNCGLNSCPCEVAEQIFTSESFSGTSIKLEESGGEFTEEQQ